MVEENLRLGNLRGTWGYAVVLCLAIVASMPGAVFRFTFAIPAAGSGNNAAQVEDARSARVRYTINDGWRFLPGDAAGAESRGYNDNSWTPVALPHTWNADDTMDDVPGYRRGVGWYRRRLEIDHALSGKEIFLYFEGANQATEVYVNGRRAGQHVGGYTAFCFDITGLVDFDSPGNNLIAVRVDNSPDADVPPIHGDFNFYGGIYRDVWLVATGPVHVTMRDHGSGGIAVSTPEVSRDRGTVRVRGSIVNETGVVQRVEAVSTVNRDDGRAVAVMHSIVVVPPLGERDFDQTSERISQPHLWSPEHPALYTVHTTLRDPLNKGAELDQISTKFGFRWFSFDPNLGFFLNGEHVKLHGTNRHQDRAGLGSAVPVELQAHDMEIIRDAGFNFVRLAHYPQAPAVLDAADRLGLILWEEIPVVNQITVSARFSNNAGEMLVEMIRQHRNHPAVILWGFMNEVFFGPPLRDEQVRATVDLARQLEATCRREDPSRATAIAFDYDSRDLYNSSGLGEITTITGWNLYHGWYYDTFADFGKFLDAQHRRFPRRPLFVSEYGANGDGRLHSLVPARGDSTIEWQRRFHEAYLPQIDARPFISGSAVWNQFDFGSEFRSESLPHINEKGLCTFDRRPKDTYYLYKAWLSPAPVLYIATRQWRFRTGAEPSAARGGGPHPVVQPVDVYTNLPEVELFNNGVSLGRRKVDTSRRATWDVPFSDGSNLIVASARYHGRTLQDSVEVHFTYRAAVLSDTSVPFKEIAVNAGSNAQFIDDAGIVWEADQPYRAGAWGYTGNEAAPLAVRKNVLNSMEDPLYQTMEQGLSGYRFDVPDGDYDVALRFVELEFTEPNRRVFRVRINGTTMIERLDLADYPGPMQPLARRFRITAAAASGIDIAFVPVTGKPVLSAVRVRRIY